MHQPSEENVSEIEQVYLLQETVDELETKIATKASEQDGKQKELDSLLQQESKYKKSLNLSVDATEEQIEARINEIIAKDAIRTAEMKTLRKDLAELKNTISTLTKQVQTLKGDKSNLEFQLHNYQLMNKTLARRMKAQGALQDVATIISQHKRNKVLPPISRGASKITHYCIFCRSEYMPHESRVCKVHYRALQGGQWTCCKKEASDTDGCLQLPHFYIEVKAHKKVSLNDGDRCFDLS